MKLIKFYDNNEVKLFDIKNDISETTDLLKIYPKVKFFDKLEKTLENYLSKVKAPKWKPGVTWKKKPLKIINSYH